jgi:hypothetical protein
VSYVQGITLAIALLGAVLGVVNTWRAIDATRLKVKVVPGYVHFVGVGDASVGFYVAVTNLSSFPITVDNVGFLYRGTKERGVLVRYTLSDGGKLPRRLEPRSSVSVYCDIPDSLRGHPVKCAYALTACGVTCTGTSKALKKVVEKPRT